VFRPYNASAGARQMPDKLAEDLIRTVNEVRRQRATLDERRDEEDALRARFQSDIDRFRLLRTGATAPRAEPVAAGKPARPAAQASRPWTPAPSAPGRRATRPG
jgi:hypothetical protein